MTMDKGEARLGRQGRVGLLDEIRGLSILLMVVYHLFFDLVYLYGVNIPAFHSPVLSFLQPFFAGVFIFISGVACRYSRNNLKRGALCFALGIALTVVTLLFVPEAAILFGILHFLGVAMMLFALLRRVLDRVSPWLGGVLAAMLFAVTYLVPKGFIGLGALTVRLPDVLYSTPFLFMVGLPGAGFFSADYFALVPWLFLLRILAYTSKKTACPRGAIKPMCRRLRLWAETPYGCTCCTSLWCTGCCMSFSFLSETSSR